MAKILIAFDASPAAARALELVSSFQVEATLLNVQPRLPTGWPGAGLDPAAVERALLEAGRAQLAPALERLPAARGEVRIGMPADALVQEARTHDLVVMGTRGAGVVRGYALGSVALRVVHHCAVPVMLVKPDDRLSAGFGKRMRVMLAMDGSAPALRAAERLAAWRGWLGELEVHMVYVQRPLTVLGQWSTQEGLQATQAAREIFRQAGIAQHTHLSVGDPALEVRTLAEQTSSDLVVLGTRGLGAAHHALVGSVALKAAAACGVPVMLVP
jgi:nucleotide-binding universal stress UspA family protein